MVSVAHQDLFRLVLLIPGRRARWPAFSGVEAKGCGLCALPRGRGGEEKKGCSGEEGDAAVVQQDTDATESPGSGLMTGETIDFVEESRRARNRLDSPFLSHTMEQRTRE